LRTSAAFLGHTVISESVHRRATTRDPPPARSAWRRGVGRCPCNPARSTKATPPAGLPTLPSRDSNGYTTRQVMKNQRSDSTRRRSRDMRVIITIGSNPTIQNSRFPHQEPQRNAKPAYLCALGYPASRRVTEACCETHPSYRRAASISLDQLPPSSEIPVPIRRPALACAIPAFAGVTGRVSPSLLDTR
jgi:hypothetical protein